MQGPVVSYRRQIAHQLRRDVSSLPGLTFVKDRREIHVRIKVDNTTTMYYINHIEGTHCPHMMQLTYHVLAADGAAGPRSDRPFHIMADSAVEDMHELEARSGCCGNRHSVSVIESDQGLCLPTFLINWKMSDQSATGTGSGDSTDHTDIAA